FRDPELRFGFSLDRYSHRLDFMEEQDFSLGRREKLIKAYTTDSGLQFFTLKQKKQSASVEVTRSRFGLRAVEKGTGIYHTERLEKSDNAVKVEYSNNRKYSVVWFQETGAGGKQVVYCLCLNEKQQKIWEYSRELNWQAGDVEFGEAACAPDGASAILLQVNEKSKGNEPSRKHFHLLGASMDGMAEPISMNTWFFVSDVELVSRDADSSFLATGFYDFKEAGKCHGVFSAVYQTGNRYINTHVQAFDKDLVSELIGAKAVEKGAEPTDLYLRKVIPRSDGGALLVAENFFVSQQMETFFMNGAPQTSPKNVYHYDDVVLLMLDSNANLQWRYVLHKRQSSYASGSYYNSIGTYACDTAVHMVYNDNSGQNNRVIHVRVNRSGTVEQNILFDSEEAYTALIPFEGKQVGYNRYVVTLIQDKKVSWLELLQND
ncbi:MAG: hypothetical protein JNL57_00525, partial [Bacteroidetes bacterium]|nr:hypothetical protein [Bacteroidota bacterium]